MTHSVLHSGRRPIEAHDPASSRAAGRRAFYAARSLASVRITMRITRLEGVTVKSRLLALTLSLGIVALPLATPAAASGSRHARDAEAIVLVGEADLPALLTSGYVTDYAIVSPTDVGLDPDAILGPALFNEDSVLTPTQLGIDNPQWGWWGRPFFRGFGFVGAGVPIFTFRSFVTPFFPASASLSSAALARRSGPQGSSSFARRRGGSRRTAIRPRALDGRGGLILRGGSPVGTRGCCPRSGSSQSSGLPLRLASERGERGKIPALASFLRRRNSIRDGLLCVGSCPHRAIHS